MLLTIFFEYFYQISCPANDKLLYILAMLKLELVQKKVLIFTNNIDTSFRLKLFLEKVRARHKIIDKFSSNRFMHLR